MKKTMLLLVLAVLVLGSAMVYFNHTRIPLVVGPIDTQFDFKNTTYTIDGQKVTLVNGVAVGQTTTTYFGSEVRHDLNNDGREDAAFILTQTMGGSGTFYYIVAALNTPTGARGSSGILLGDRIAPQSTSMGKGSIVVVNYADRNLSDSFVVPPSVGKSMSVLLDAGTMELGQVANDFEGEADPATMTLGMQTWHWIQTVYSDGKTVASRTPKFALTFSDGNRFSATTDCNGVGGEYKVVAGKITFTKMMSTMMYCEGSQEADFSKMIEAVQSYHFTSKGELVFDLKMDSGSMIFR